MRLTQYIKRLIVKWLGIDRRFSDAWTDSERRLEERLQRQAARFDQELSGLSAKYALECVTADAAMAVALQTHKVELQAEYDRRTGLVLDAAITAAEKIARAISDSGDASLKEYVDSCFNTLLGIDPEANTYIGSEQCQLTQ